MLCCRVSRGTGPLSSAIRHALEKPACQVFGVVLDPHPSGTVLAELHGRDGAWWSVFALQVKCEQVAVVVAQAVAHLGGAEDEIQCRAIGIENHLRIAIANVAADRIEGLRERLKGFSL